MMTIRKAIATAGGIGYIRKGAGSVAAAVYCLLWWCTPLGDAAFWQLAAVLPVLVIGILSAGAVENEWGPDSHKVVIDEVAGMLITLLFMAPTLVHMIAGFVLFRFFDIVKPLGIRKTEGLPGGWGVMADDVLAALYSLAILQTLVYLKLL